MEVNSFEVLAKQMQKIDFLAFSPAGLILEIIFMPRF